MYRPRAGEQPYAEPNRIDDCGDIAAAAKTHARQILAAGVDFIFVDLTNLPFQSQFTDVLGVRPLEVLFEEWQKLRDQGIPTPDIAVWVPVQTPTAGQAPTWQAVNRLYNDPRYADLVLRDKSNRKIWFAVSSAFRPADPVQVAQIESNGGLNDSVVAPLWGLLKQAQFDQGDASWMQPCEQPSRQGNNVFTTQIKHDRPCNQRHTANSPIGSVLSASVSYQLSYASLPFLSTGRNNGLTFKKQFETAFDVQPDWLLLNAWNEFIAQPQKAPEITDHGPLVRSMGIVPTPGDPSDAWLWVDAYGAEFSRDIEPTVEYGDGMYTLMQSCLKVYRGGGCAVMGAEACCQREPENVLVWSARVTDPDRDMDTHHLLTTSAAEGIGLLETGDWEEVCNPISGPPDICSTITNVTGDSPFMLSARPGANRRALYRCLIPGQHHFFSTDPDCEGQTPEGILGFISTVRASHTPRPLSRCRSLQSSKHFHWLAERCPTDLPGVVHEGVVGFVR